VAIDVVEEEIREGDGREKGFLHATDKGEFEHGERVGEVGDEHPWGVADVD